MSLQIILPGEKPSQPWRNGGGQTRELLTWPSADDWRLRISMADVAQDGEFSHFPGVQRALAIIDGAGIGLDMPDGVVTLRARSEPLLFDGALAPYCRLIEGKVLDFNLMARQGNGGMLSIDAARDWTLPARAQTGLFTCEAGILHTPGYTLRLPAGVLFWQSDWADKTVNWRFEPDSSTSEQKFSGWWLYYQADTTL